jgi:hypothetical protein
MTLEFNILVLSLTHATFIAYDIMDLMVIHTDSTV